jgi:hypothetical protein
MRSLALLQVFGFVCWYGFGSRQWFGFIHGDLETPVWRMSRLAGKEVDIACGFGEFDFGMTSAPSLIVSPEPLLLNVVLG